MALCDSCNHLPQNIDRPSAVCQVDDCDNRIPKGHKFCQPCAAELLRCECCGQKLVPKKK